MQLFAAGLSTRKIRDLVQEIYGIEVSPELVSKVTDVVMEEYLEWQDRPLKATYAVVYLEALRVRVRCLLGRCLSLSG